jgi:ubiquinol-cytochrome c reductase cytochrome c1 subunit
MVMKYLHSFILLLIINQATLFLPVVSQANEQHHIPLKKLVWPFEGIFGTFDRQAAQRGAQVYFEVCGACHGLYNLYYRNLEGIGFSEAEVKALAAKYNVMDGPNDAGEMFERPALPSNKFATPYPNKEAARAANNGAYPVDLSLIIKARADGANYVYSILNGYNEAPEGFHLMNGLYYNTYFPGHQISMPPPLTADQVTYSDGTKATVDQMAKDVVVFLQWAAEPEMEDRKSLGLKVMIFLACFTVLFYFAKKKIWKDIK